MKEKHRTTLRILCAVLSICLLAVAAAPMASALTPEQEQVLQSGQRSLNNPNGTFTAPTPGSVFQYFQQNSYAAVQMALRNVIQNFQTGQAEVDFSKIMAYAPLVKAGDALPPNKERSYTGEGLTPDDGLLWLFDLDFRRLFNDLGGIAAFFTLDMNNMYIALQETDQANIYNVIAFCATRRGEAYWTTIGLVYDAETGYLMGADETGIYRSGLELEFDHNIARLSPGNTNKRFGFNIFYDIFSPIALMHLDTIRFPFEYGGKEYMVQFWKGSYYTISNGGEICLYERPLGTFLQWNPSDDNKLEMTMRIYQKDKFFLDFGPVHSWWIGGFRFGDAAALPVLPPKDLRMAGEVIFEDPGMRDAFWASFEVNKTDLFTGKLEGMVFSYDWLAG